MRDNRGLPEAAVALSAGSAKAQPVSRRKVDGLCAVEALIEATVVGAGKGDHELTLLLHSTTGRGDATPKLWSMEVLPELGTPYLQSRAI